MLPDAGGRPPLCEGAGRRSARRARPSCEMRELRSENVGAQVLRRHPASARPDDCAFACASNWPRLAPKVRSGVQYAVAAGGTRARAARGADRRRRRLAAFPRRRNSAELALFDDGLVAVARKGHPAFRGTQREDATLRLRIRGVAPAGRRRAPATRHPRVAAPQPEDRPRSLGDHRDLHGRQPVGLVRPHSAQRWKRRRAISWD